MPKHGDKNEKGFLFLNPSVLKKERNNGEVTWPELAKKYGVSKSLIFKIGGEAKGRFVRVGGTRKKNGHDKKIKAVNELLTKHSTPDNPLARALTWAPGAKRIIIIEME